MEKKPLRILVVNNTLKENPSYIVRNKTVGEALNRKGHKVFYSSMAKIIDIDSYDFFIFNRFYEGSLQKEIDALRQLRKIIIYETDDNYFSMDSNLPLEKLKKHATPSANELVKSADAITVSTRYLADIISKKTKQPIFWIPNAIDFAKYEPRKNKNKQLRIGWQGSDVHIGDLLLVIGPLKRLQKKYGFKLVLIGLIDTDLKKFYKLAKEKNDGRRWSRNMIKLYEELQDIDYEHYPFTQTYGEFRKKLTEMDLDIGLCPLEETEFNKAKSCLKYYEYVAVGTTAIGSDVIPYTREMFTKDLVRNKERKWEKALEKLITDEEYRENRLNSQYRWVRDNRSIDVVVNQWEQFFYIISNAIRDANSNTKK